MILLIILAVPLVIGLVLLATSDVFDTRNLIGQLLTAFCGIGLVIALIMIPVHRMWAESFILSCGSVQVSLLNAREDKNISPYELAAIQQKVVATNQEIVQCKYWASSLFSIYWPESIKELQLIK